MDITTPS